MIDSQFAAFALAAIAAGGFAYVFLYPLLSGERRAEKRRIELGRDLHDDERRARAPADAPRHLKLLKSAVTLDRRSFPPLASPVSLAFSFHGIRR